MADPHQKSSEVIAGTGFAGYDAARELARLMAARNEITVINSTAYFLYLPLVEPTHIRVLLPSRLPKTRFVLGTVNHIDHRQKVVSWAGREGASGQLGYDRLILTAGSVNKLLIAGPAGHERPYGLQPDTTNADVGLPPGPDPERGAGLDCGPGAGARAFHGRDRPPKAQAWVPADTNRDGVRCQPRHSRHDAPGPGARSARPRAEAWTGVITPRAVTPTRSCSSRSGTPGRRCFSWTRAPCLEWALASGQEAGGWGGTSKDERRALRRTRSSPSVNEVVR